LRAEAVTAMAIPLHADAASNCLSENEEVRSAFILPVLLGSVIPSVPFKPMKAVATTGLFGTVSPFYQHSPR
jgi:hypothetical protein